MKIDIDIERLEKEISYQVTNHIKSCVNTKEIKKTVEIYLRRSLSEVLRKDITMRWIRDVVDDEIKQHSREIIKKMRE